MNVYSFHGLTEQQVDAIRLALAFEMDRREHMARDGVSDANPHEASSAFHVISQQWHAQHVAQRDAKLREAGQ